MSAHTADKPRPDACDCSPECRRLLSIRMEAFNAFVQHMGNPLEIQLDALNRLAERRLSAKEGAL